MTLQRAVRSYQAIKERKKRERDFARVIQPTLLILGKALDQLEAKIVTAATTTWRSGLGEAAGVESMIEQVREINTHYYRRMRVALGCFL